MSSAGLGGVAGLAASIGFGVAPAIPLCCGLAAGVALGSPRRARDAESWLSGLVLSLGLAAVAGGLIVQGLAGYGLIAGGLSLAVASGPGQGSTLRKVGGFAAVSALFTLALVASFFVIPPHALSWQVPALGEVLAVSGLVGATSWLGGALSVGIERAAPSLEHEATSAAVAEAEAPASRVEAAETAVVPFGTERADLGVVTDRIFLLADALVERAPSERAFAEQIRASVNGTLDQADEAIARWRLVGQAGHDDRVEQLRARIEANEARAEAADAGVRPVLQRTIAGQRQTLSEYEGAQRARVAFGMRLEQLESGFQMMELALERALTAGGTLDSSDVDAIVEAMGEVNATFSVELIEEFVA